MKSDKIKPKSDPKTSQLSPAQLLDLLQSEELPSKYRTSGFPVERIGSEEIDSRVVDATPNAIKDEINPGCPSGLFPDYSSSKPASPQSGFPVDGGCDEGGGAGAGGHFFG